MQLKLDPVQVRLIGVQIVDPNTAETSYRVKLKFQNPNPVPLPIRGLHFDLSLNGQPLLPTVSDQSLDLNAHGAGELTIEVSAQNPGLAEQIRRFQDGWGGSLGYGINGSMAFANDIEPLDFSNQGHLGTLPPQR